MEERLCALQGYELKGADRLSLYTKTNFPENFQEPEFTRKYDGTGCPKTHLRYYMRKMARYADNVPFLIHTFQDSLEGIALTWFIALDIEEFTSWEDLTNEFLQQYRFNTELALTREELTRVEKKRNESFKAFAQRWRTMASQVKPALNEREMKQLFLKTLPPEYFQGLVFSGCQTFSQLVDVGEGVEWALIEGRISTGGTKKFQVRKDKEAAVEVALVQESFYPKSPTAPAHKPMAVQGSSSRAYDKGKRPFRKEFSPLPRPLSKLLPMLLEKRMVAKEVPRDNPTRFAGFDVTKTCEYHMGEMGHDVDSCNVLRYKVQQLLDKNILTFKEAQPNVQQNPLPDHAEGVNSIFEETQASQQPLVANASKLYESLVLAGYYGGHQDVTPKEKLNRVRRMVAMGVIRCGEEEENVVSMIIPSSFHSSFCNIARISRAKKIMPGISKTPALYEEGMVAMITPMVIELSNEETTGDIEMEIAEPTMIDLIVEEMSAIEVTGGNIFITRSGRYAPDKGIEKKVVTKEEAKQFLAIVKSSEFNVVDQAAEVASPNLPPRVVEILQKHGDILLKVLNEVHVPETIDEVQLEEFVGAVLLKDQISFTDEDLPPDGPNHTKALHISAKHESTLVCRVLIDNGSALNICPLATLHRLGIDLGRIRTGKSTVRAFDGMKKEVIGEIELELLIGPVLFQIVFQVLDIPSAFNFLLGRPWIHTAGAVASSLHQKVRFVVDNRLITVHGESDFKIYHETTIPYVEPECTEESSFQTFELVSMVHVLAGSFTKVPELSKPTIAAGKIMLASGYNPGEGLGSHGQGVRKPIEARKNFKRRGLGYVEKWGGHNNQGEDERYQSPFSPLLEETFPGPPRMLFEEEEDIHGVTELFKEDVICTILACEEAESSEVMAIPPK
ncbi:uncharacterized protein LOC120292628 [Eucalyptus grandis]|uniref:uncharacterized protein LOC120292628 n=1 Tax=Eucalyptus grandis TaxID=71139 RepID=UPI00192EE4ED|nr:uncharacterized protein LOC120292628 [Eucalyptus grandis]